MKKAPLDRQGVSKALGAQYAQIYFPTDYEDLQVQTGKSMRELLTELGVAKPRRFEAIMMSVGRCNKFLDIIAKYIGDEKVRPRRPRKASFTRKDIMAMWETPRYKNRPLAIAVALGISYHAVVEVLKLPGYPRVDLGWDP